MRRFGSSNLGLVFNLKNNIPAKKRGKYVKILNITVIFFKKNKTLSLYKDKTFMVRHIREKIKQGISIFQRNKLLNYSIQQCHRDNIESISQAQNSVSDRIF